jgi:hypothetical protein
MLEALVAVCLSTLAATPEVTRRSVILVPVPAAKVVREDYQLTDALHGVNFDLDADGRVDRMAWTYTDDEIGFLVEDRNNNGTVDDGSELFGSATVPGAKDGFEALSERAFAESGVRSTKLTSDDAVLPQAEDLDGSQPQRRLGTDRTGTVGNRFSVIPFGVKVVDELDRHGNLFAYGGYVQVRTGPGKKPAVRGWEIQQCTRPIYDVYLQRAQ